MYYKTQQTMKTLTITITKATILKDIQDNAWFTGETDTSIATAKGWTVVI